MNTPPFDLLDDILFQLSIRINLSDSIYHDHSWHEEKIQYIYNVWAILEGNVIITINNQTHVAAPGDVILFSPGDYYSAYTDSQHCRFLFTRYSLEMGNKIDLLSSLNFSGIITKKNLGNLVFTFYEAYWREYVPQKRSLKLYSIFFGFMTQLLYTAKTHFIPFYPEGKDIPPVHLTELLTYMNKHYMDALTVKQLALMMHMSEKYFISFFSSYVGISPKQYLISNRMRYAEELLNVSKWNITEISKILGYSDQYSFSKAFHKYYGESPTTFRKNHSQT